MTNIRTLNLYSQLTALFDRPDLYCRTSAIRECSVVVGQGHLVMATYCGDIGKGFLDFSSRSSTKHGKLLSSLETRLLNMFLWQVPFKIEGLVNSQLSFKIGDKRLLVVFGHLFELLVWSVLMSSFFSPVFIPIWHQHYWKPDPVNHM